MAGLAEFPVTVVPVAQLGTAVAAPRAAADTIQRPKGTPLEDIPVAAVGTRVVGAAIPVAEDMAAVIAKKLGDSTSLREAAT
jgi:hypothetical protein